MPSSPRFLAISLRFHIKDSLNEILLMHATIKIVYLILLRNKDGNVCPVKRCIRTHHSGKKCDLGSNRTAALNE